jgi:dienelactone hydrolase
MERHGRGGIMVCVREAYENWRRSKRWSSILLELMIMGAIFSLLPACAAQWVNFHSANRRAEPLQGILSKPKGEGPFPAVILLHSNGGIRQPNISEYWPYFLNDLGYVTLAVDTFGSRHLTNCSSAGRNPLCTAGAEMMIDDAYGAFAYLTGLPFVNSQKVSVMGFSLGATAANRLAGRARGNTQTFKSAIALYGSCEFSDYDSIPLLQIIGEHDRWAMTCKYVTSKAVEVHVLPGAYHAFDNPNASGRTDVGGNYMQYSSTASSRAGEIVQAFLAKHSR